MAAACIAFEKITNPLKSIPFTKVCDSMPAYPHTLLCEVKQIRIYTAIHPLHPKKRDMMLMLYVSATVLVQGKHLEVAADQGNEGRL